MKIFKYLNYIWTIIAVLLILLSVYIFKNNIDFTQKAQISQGKVIMVTIDKSGKSATYKPVIEFYDHKGIRIEFASFEGSNPPKYTVGDKVEVLFNPENPIDAKINSFFSIWGGVLIMSIVGIVFFVIGCISISKEKKKRAIVNFLKSKGTSIETHFQNVVVNDSCSLNGKHPYQIVSQWLNPATSQIHIFTSDNIWFDPSSYLKNNKIKVIIDSKNAQNYIVDLSFLPSIG